MPELAPETIIHLDVFQIAIPLAQPYHLSKIYGTQTHSDAVVVRMTTASGIEGWGEGDPGGLSFTGDTSDMIMSQLTTDSLGELIGVRVDDWVESGQGLNRSGAWGAALDVAAYDALGQIQKEPVWTLLGERQRDVIPSLWPTSSGTAAEDLQVIEPKLAEGFETFMLKMGSRPVKEDAARLIEVVAALPDKAKVMVDANQGWQLDEAVEFFREIGNTPIALIEQPVMADHHQGLARLREVCPVPLSVDESLQTIDDATQLAESESADVFSIKISKNGGLRAGLEIARTAQTHGISVLMNSMLELGITQCASLHLGCVLNCLIDCGHAFMSTLRMSDDISDFSDFVTDGNAVLPQGPGLGIQIDEDKIRNYLRGELHV